MTPKKRTINLDDLFVEPPKMTKKEQRAALDKAHKAMHLAVKKAERR